MQTFFISEDKTLSDEKIPFPALSGTSRLSDSDKERIAEAAWKQANGSALAFEQLCAEHVRGEINLFGEHPTAIGGEGASAAARRQAAEQRAAPNSPADSAAGLTPGTEGHPLTPTQSNAGEVVAGETTPTPALAPLGGVPGSEPVPGIVSSS